MTLRELRNVGTIVVVGVAALMLLGYPDWAPWPQLLSGVAVAVLATFAAPEMFGWRDEQDRRARRHR